MGSWPLRFPMRKQIFWDLETFSKGQTFNGELASQIPKEINFDGELASQIPNEKIDSFGVRNLGRLLAVRRRRAICPADQSKGLLASQRANRDIFGVRNLGRLLAVRIFVGSLAKTD